MKSQYPNQVEEEDYVDECTFVRASDIPTDRVDYQLEDRVSYYEHKYALDV